MNTSIHLEKTEDFKNIRTKELVDVSDRKKQQEETRSRGQYVVRAILAEEEYKNQLIEGARQSWLDCIL